MKHLAMLGLMSAALLAGTAMAGDAPERDVSARHHPNIAAAQKLSREAFNKVSAAQQANEWDMAGHAAKAKDLLEQASEELKQAAEAANKDKK